MTEALELTVMYADETFGTALANNALKLPPGADHVQIAPATRIPGAMGGWFELAVNFGVLGIPASVVAGCIANWLTTAIKSRQAPDGQSFKAKLVFLQGEKSVEIELTAGDATTLAQAIETTLARVNSQP